jgi:hypothetical protein
LPGYRRDQRDIGYAGSRSFPGHGSLARDARARGREIRTKLLKSFVYDLKSSKKQRGKQLLQ